MNKRILCLLLTLLLTTGVLPAAVQAEEGAWKTFYVSPDGSDEADGSENAPFQTLARARDEVRKYNRDMKGNIVVNLLPGRFELSERLELDVEDSGTGGYDVIWRGADGEQMSTISGAEKVEGAWTQGEDGIWHVKAENLEFARELFVNGQAAIRAREPKKVSGNDHYKVGEAIKGFTIDKSKIGLYENPEDVEIHSAHTWKSAIHHVEDIIPDPENENQVIVLMDRGVWEQYQALGLGTMETHYSRGFVVENAYELLDEPGEFYFNKKTKTLSYYPREGEDMTKAEVLCPQIDQLLYVRGQRYDNVIHNIRFENICFAHATNEVFETVSYAGGQGEYPYPSEMSYRMGRAANLVAWAENIDFQACQFFGLTTMGLHFREGVKHSEVVGNIFSDLGATAFAAGNLEQIEMREPSRKTGPSDVAWKAGWSASYVYYPGTAYAFEALNTQRSDEESMAPGKGWYSEPWAVEEGTKPWVKIDLDDDFTLETIRLSFPNDASDEQRSHFEVLVSNDEDFAEYKTVKTFEGAAPMQVDVPVGDGEKYRYIMLRKTVSEPFALNGIWAMSNDRGPRGNMGAPSDLLVANNYFVRTSQQLWQTYPIWLNYTKRVQAVHNEIYGAPYSGMSIGWGWDNNNATTSGENLIAYNRIDNTMRHINDGGGIYIFGKQWGTKITGNYISNTKNLEAGIYYDNGCSGVSSVDNVCINTGDAWLLNGGTRQNSMKGMWSDGGQYQIADDSHQEVGYTAENPKLFSYSNPPEEVIKIIAEAGLEEQWEWIRERVPDGVDLTTQGPDAAESYQLKSEVGMQAPKRVNDDMQTANTMLSLGDFGYLPWQFDPTARAELEYWMNRITNTSDRTDDYSGGHLEEMEGLQAAIVALNKSSVHPSWEEMLAMCEEVEQSAMAGKELGGYPAESVAQFLRKVKDIKALNPQTKAEKAVAAGRLEKVYSELDAQRYRADILSLTLGGVVAEIDTENRTATVSLPNGVDRTSVVPEIFTNATAKVAVELGSLDYTKPQVTIPLFETGLRKYVYWTLRIVPEMENVESGRVSVSPADWVQGNPNTRWGAAGGAITLSQWFEPNMCGKPMSGKISFSLMAPRADAKDGIGIIFSAQTSELEATGKEVKNTYYMLTLKNQSLQLYKVRGGVRTLCGEAKSIAFAYGKYNPFEIEITSEGSLDRILVKLEGDVLLDTLVDDPIGQTGYFGILTQNMTVRLK